MPQAGPNTEGSDADGGDQSSDADGLVSDLYVQVLWYCHLNLSKPGLCLQAGCRAVKKKNNY